MLNDSEKLKKFLINENLTQKKFEDKTSVKQQVLSRLLQNKKEKDTDPDLIATAALKHALLKYYQYDIETDTYVNNNTKREKSSVTFPIPFYNAKASAGVGEALPDYPEHDVIYFDTRWLKNVLGVNPANLSIIQAKGDSMQSDPIKSDDIKDGDLLMIDESRKEPINNQVFVVNLGNNDIVVKKIDRHWNGNIILLSNNPKYPDIIPTKEAFIVGKVVWNGSKENV